MLDEIFLQILNMSFTASYAILLVLLARLLLEKVPKIFSYALWSVVFFRLVCPFSFESNLSWFHLTGRTIEQMRPFPEEFTTLNNALPTANATIELSPIVETAMSFVSGIFTLLWLVGIVVLLLYSAVSLFRLRHQLIGAVKLRDNIYLADHIQSPFVIGVVRPKIYLPSTLSEREQGYIILHEQTHIKRFDHIVKILAFCTLCIHWFNPLVWPAFVLCVKDMEMSCDESVMKQMSTDIRNEYSASLLSLATGRKMTAGTPLAFGEGDTASRIKNVMNYKKPAFWVIAMSVIAVVAVGVGLMANPMQYGEMSKVIEVYPPTNADVLLRAEIVMPRGTKEYTEPAQIQEFLDYLSAVEVSKSNVGLNRGDDRNSTNQLIFYYKTYPESYFLKININDDFTEVWIDNNTKPSLSHTIKKPAEIIRFMDTLLGSASPLNDMRPMIMVDGVLYLDTNKEISAKIEGNAILGEIASAALATEKPTENGQCNFSSGVGAKYAAYEDGMAVFLNNKWFFFEKDPETTDIDVTAGAKLSSLPKEYSSSMAIKNGDYVDVHGNISNAEAMDYFISAVSKKEKAFIRTTIYTIEGDPIITDFDFDGKSFSVYRDTTRDKFGNQEIKNYTYQNLVPFISDSAPKTQYFYITNLSEITQKDFEEGVDGVILLDIMLPKIDEQPL